MPPGRVRASWPLLSILVVTACGVEPATPAVSPEEILLVGHQELKINASSEPLPLVVGTEGEIGVCLRTAAEVDSSQWEARSWLETDGRGEGVPSTPTARLGTTLCFPGPEARPRRPGPERLCLEVVDRYDGQSVSSSCLPFEFLEDDGDYVALRDEGNDLIRQRGTLPLETFLSGLDAVGERAERAGFPLLRLRLELIGAYVLRREGSDASMQRAAQRLEASRPWIDAPAAAAWSAQLAYERATLALAQDWELERAWRFLEQAENGYRRVADPNRIVATMKQAEILARVGAVAEGRDRLRTALDRCAAAPCKPHLVASARNTLAWLLLLDADAGPDDLAEAESILAKALAGLSDSTDRLERANVTINLAYARSRLGLPYADGLADARAAILTGDRESPRSRDLLGWTRLVEALDALHTGGPSRALLLGRSIAVDADAPRLRAWGLSCQARAYRLLNRLEEAEEAIERALVLHEYATAGKLGQDVAIGPGERADDFLRAARIALEQGRPDRAWERLQQLDERIGHRRSDGSCHESLGLDSRDERDRLLDRLAALELPASGSRRQQRASIREQTMRRLQELLREQSSCPAPAIRAADRADFRGFAMHDEVLLLHRRPDGTVALYRRTPLDRTELTAAIDDLVRSLEQKSEDEAGWNDRVALLARALAPRPTDLNSVTRFAMHGILQSVPLEALPLDGVVAGSPRWLGEATLVTLRPAGVEATPAPTGEGPALFVVDPEQNLPSGKSAAAGYRRLFPQATVLSGEQASRVAVNASMRGARWLHVDAHAVYDPAFPELSSLSLADGPWTADEIPLEGTTLEMANLSACRSGSWPVTADSGRFGLAGWLARSGVGWVVGARTELDDAVAAQFNRAFYDSLADGQEMTESLRRAGAAVRERFPPSKWAALLLLHGGREIPGGQIGLSRTPQGLEEVDPEGRTSLTGGVR